MYSIIYALIIEKKGQSLMEVILGVAIFGIIVSAFASLVISGISPVQRGIDGLKAQTISQEGVEVARSIKNEAWNKLRFNQSDVETSSGKWVFSGASTTKSIGKFTRKMNFEDVCRDSSGDITTCPGDYTDPHTKKLTSKVIWKQNMGLTSSIKKTAFLTNWDSLDWVQTDWSGGAGQDIWSDSTKYKEDDGNVDVSTTGEVKLKKQGEVCSDKTWPFDVAGDYNYDSDKIKIENSFSKLKINTINQTKDKGFDQTVGKKVWPFSDSDNYILSDSNKVEVINGVARLNPSNIVASGTSKNAGFNNDASNWSFNSWNVDAGGETAPSGTWQSSGGNPGGWVNINFDSNSNDEVGGYWEQSVNITEDNPTVDITLNWQSENFPENPDSLKLYAFLDSSSGEPTAGNEFWSKSISSVEDWSGDVNIDASGKVSNSGTYYLKIAALIRRPTGQPQGPFEIGFDNVELNWKKGSYPTDEPYLKPKDSFSVDEIKSWNSFNETASKPTGTEIYYQLSDDEGSNWQYWDGSSWTAAGSGDYNVASTVDNNIDTLPTSSKSIIWRSFLSSGGNNQVTLDELSIGINSSGGQTWQFSSWDQASNEASPSGQGSSTGGNPGSWVNVLFGEDSVSEVGGFWEQKVNFSKLYPTSTLYLDYKIPQYDNNINSLDLYVFLDQTSGEPTIGDEIWSTNITSGDSSWVSIPKQDITSEISSTGTYYFKAAAFVNYSSGGPQGPIEVGFDNAVIKGEQYFTTKPDIYPSSPYSPSSSDQWSSFTETASKPTGTEIYYQLSDDGGSNWQYWDGSSWTAAGSGDYNVASTVDDRIWKFDTANNKIQFKAFLSSSGERRVKLDEVEIGCTNKQLETGSTEVDNTWETINLDNNYKNPVIVASYNERDNSDPASVRIDNITSSTFDIRLQNPSGSNLNQNKINYFVIEEGKWNLDGTKIEASTYKTDTVGSSAGGWSGDSINFDRSFSSGPIVLHQVMSNNDSSWISSFVSRDGDRTNPPSNSGMWLALNGAEVTSNHSSEEIGWIAVEPNESGAFDGVDFETQKTTEAVQGHDDGCNTFSYNNSYSNTPNSLGFLQEVEDEDGGWAVSCSNSSTEYGIHTEEDQVSDSERSHISEISGFITFKNSFSFSNAAVGNESYKPDGYLISSAFDTSTSSKFQVAEWSENTNCGNCNIKLQVRVAPDDGGSPGTWTKWYGLDGSGSFFTNSDGGLIPLDLNDNQWVQYKAILNSNTSRTSTPVLKKVKINYK